MRTIKKRLPEGKKYAFGSARGVKVKFINKDLAKNKSKKSK